MFSPARSPVHQSAWFAFVFCLHSYIYLLHVVYTYICSMLWIDVIYTCFSCVYVYIMYKIHNINITIYIEARIQQIVQFSGVFLIYFGGSRTQKCIWQIQWSSGRSLACCGPLQTCLLEVIVCENSNPQWMLVMPSDLAQTLRDWYFMNNRGDI